MHSRARFSLRNFAVFEGFFVLFFKCLKKKGKKNLKCDLMVLKAVPTSDETVLIPFWLQRKKKFQLDLNFGPRDIDLTRYWHMSTAM